MLSMSICCKRCSSGFCDFCPVKISMCCICYHKTQPKARKCELCERPHCHYCVVSEEGCCLCIHMMKLLGGRRVMVTCQNCKYWDELPGLGEREGVCLVTLKDWREIRITQNGHAITKPDFFCKHGTSPDEETREK